jgi:hypothetical protein
VVACHLWDGYFNAGGLPEDIPEAVERLRDTVEKLAARTKQDRVLLLAGSDHQPPEERATEIASALARATGWDVRVGLLEDFVAGLEPDAMPSFSGEMVGGRIANLLPGVWSTRTYLKLHDRRTDMLLTAWAEPWAALGSRFGLHDERPALRAAWRELLANQAHDSICGCSQDAVHEQMLGRYATAAELATETTDRALERIAGLGPRRRAAWSDELDLAVFNPSPHPRSEVVRFHLDTHPPFRPGSEHDVRIHPLLWATLQLPDYEVDGVPVRVVEEGPAGQLQLIPTPGGPRALEFEVRDVPAFGWKRLALRKGKRGEPRDQGAVAIRTNDITVIPGPLGTFDVTFGDRTFEGLCGLESTGDRGDTYDYDPVHHSVAVRAGTHVRSYPDGTQIMSTTRYLTIPAIRDRMSAQSASLIYRSPGIDAGRENVSVTCRARVTPGLRRMDIAVEVNNRAPDHRLRLQFPTGRWCSVFRAATTFGVAERHTRPREDSAWRHPAPTTFPCQGWVEANGLVVAAPGLIEAEVTQDGVILITLVRAVGALSRPDLRTRRLPAGPGTLTPGAQCFGRFDTVVSLMPSGDPRGPRDAELGMRCVIAGDEPLVPDGVSLLTLEPRELLLSALKPADDGDGIVLRVHNPTDQGAEAVVRLGFDIASAHAVRLDEEPADHDVDLDGREVRFAVPPRALRSVRMA